MPYKGDTERAIARIAERQHGVLTARQLHGLGLSRSAVSGRAAAGRLHRVHRGVYAAGQPRLSQEGRWMAAVLACGGGPTEEASILEHWGAALSHRSAAALWGLLDVGDGPVEVSVPSGAGRRARAGIRLHRCPSLAAGDVSLLRGVPVTRPGRTLSDLRLEAMRGRARHDEVRHAIRQAELLGVPLEHTVETDRTRSDLERAFLRLCRRHGVPAPEVNVRVGRHLVDFLWRAQRLVVETDGYRYHRGREAFEQDRSRDLDLRALGYAVMRLSARQVRAEPGRVAEALAAALRVGGRGRQ